MIPGPLTGAGAAAIPPVLQVYAAVQHSNASEACNAVSSCSSVAQHAAPQDKYAWTQRCVVMLVKHVAAHAGKWWMCAGQQSGWQESAVAAAG